jgi:hypothetical protein
MRAVIIAIAILLAVLVAHTAEMNEEIHGAGCGCDTCCAAGLVPITNPGGVDYAKD